MLILVLVGIVFVIIWEILHGRISLNLVLLLLLVNFVSWGQVGNYVYNPHCNCQVKFYSSPCLTAACAAAIS